MYRAHIAYYCPVLNEACYYAGASPIAPGMLSDVDIDVFGLFVQWIYNQSLLNKNGEAAYQHRLIGLWVLARRLLMPRLQNDAIDMLEQRRRQERRIQIKSFQYVYDNTDTHDKLRLYLINLCARSMEEFAQDEIKDFFPPKMVAEINEAVLVKFEHIDEGFELDRVNMTKYHVEED